MKVEAPFIHLIKLHTKYYLYDVNSKMIVNISNDLFDFFKSNENIKAEIENKGDHLEVTVTQSNYEDIIGTKQEFFQADE